MTTNNTYNEALKHAREIYESNMREWNENQEDWEAYPAGVFAMAQLLEDLYGFDTFDIAEEIVAD